MLEIVPTCAAVVNQSNAYSYHDKVVPLGQSQYVCNYYAADPFIRMKIEMYLNSLAPSDVVCFQIFSFSNPRGLDKAIHQPPRILATAAGKSSRVRAGRISGCSSSVVRYFPVRTRIP